MKTAVLLASLTTLSVVATVRAVAADPAAVYADPARFEADIAAFEAADRADPPPAGAILGLGSSSMRGWHGDIHRDLAPLTIVARGFGGSTMYDALQYVDRVVLPYHPRAILLYEGDNDIAAGVSPAMVCDTFRALTDRIHTDLPDCRVYFLAIKPSISRWALWSDMQDANRRIAAACAADPRMTFVDTASAMQNEEGTPKLEIFLPDNLHMNRQGYEIWRDVLRPILMKAELPFEAAASAEPAAAGAGRD